MRSGVPEHVLHHAQVERMPAREVEPAVDVVDRRAERLGELDERMEARRLAADVLGDDHRALGGGEHLGRSFERRGIGCERVGTLAAAIRAAAPQCSSGCSCSQAS